MPTSNESNELSREHFAELSGCGDKDSRASMRPGDSDYSRRSKVPHDDEKTVDRPFDESDNDYAETDDQADDEDDGWWTDFLPNEFSIRGFLPWMARRLASSPDWSLTMAKQCVNACQAFVDVLADDFGWIDVPYLPHHIDDPDTAIRALLNLRTYLRKKAAEGYADRVLGLKRAESAAAAGSALPSSPDSDTGEKTATRQVRPNSDIVVDIEVDIAKNTIVVMGQPHVVRPNECQIVNALVSARDDTTWWVSSTKLTKLKACSGNNISRVMKELKGKVPALADLITAEKAKGYRLKP